MALNGQKKAEGPTLSYLYTGSSSPVILHHGCTLESLGEQLSTADAYTLP